MKRALVLVVLLACSKNEPTPAPLPSDPTAPKALSTGATGDACVDACVAKHPGGAATLQALDDCVVDACQPIEEARTGGACPAVGPGASKVAYGYPATDACMATACCAQATACAGDPACAELNACLDTCNAK